MDRISKMNLFGILSDRYMGGGAVARALTQIKLEHTIIKGVKYI